MVTMREQVVTMREQVRSHNEGAGGHNEMRGMYIVGTGEPNLFGLSQACSLTCSSCKTMSQQETASHIWGLITRG